MSIVKRMKDEKILIGMVHCLPMPGTRHYKGDIQQIIDKAVADAVTLEKAGFDAVLVEPTLDNPTGLKRGPLQTAVMSVVASKVKQAISIEMGIAYMSDDCLDAFAIAKASGASFVRLFTFVDTVVFFTGEAYPSAVRAFEVKRNFDMHDIDIIADIHVKHSKLKYPDVTIEQSAYMAQSQGADAIIITGSSTGRETPLDIVNRVKKVVNIPVLTGSGVNADNVHEQLNCANGAIVGSSVKHGGILSGPVDFNLVKEIVEGK